MRTRPRSARARTVERNRRPKPRQKCAGSARARSARSAVPKPKRKRSFRAEELTNAAVAAGGPRPPGAIAPGHGALKLVDVAGEIPLTAVKRLLEVF